MFWSVYHDRKTVMIISVLMSGISIMGLNRDLHVWDWKHDFSSVVFAWFQRFVWKSVDLMLKIAEAVIVPIWTPSTGSLMWLLMMSVIESQYCSSAITSHSFVFFLGVFWISTSRSFVQSLFHTSMSMPVWSVGNISKVSYDFTVL